MTVIDHSEQYLCS